jgi:hypothetical protein
MNNKLKHTIKFIQLWRNKNKQIIKLKIFINVKNNKSKNNKLKNIKIQLNKSLLMMLMMEIKVKIAQMIIIHTKNNKIINLNKVNNIYKTNN